MQKQDAAKCTKQMEIFCVRTNNMSVASNSI